MSKQYSIINKIEDSKIFAVVRADETNSTLDIAKALVEGGLKTIEISMDCPNAIQAIKELSQIKDLSVAAGSIISNKQAKVAIEAGAELIVSPVYEMSLVKFCKGYRVPFICGASTATEAYNAWKMGVSITKIFPVKALGGPRYIKDILKPMPFLRTMPTSGVHPEDFIEYLKSGAIAVGMGRTLYERETELSTITQKTKAVVQKLKEFKSSL